MKVKLVFDDWRQIGKPDSIYNTELGLALSSGDLHSGTTFDAKVIIDENVMQEIREAMNEHGAYPVFRFVVEREA